MFLTASLLQDGRTAAVWLASSEPQSPATSLSRCRASCLATAPRARFCSNAQDVIEVDPSFTFWMYLTVRVFVGVISFTSFAMFEVSEGVSHPGVHGDGAGCLPSDMQALRA